MYIWLWMALISGAIFGLYDICTKKALGKIPLLNSLFLFTLFNFALVSFEFNNAMKTDLTSIILILVKSVFIFFSWMLSFVAIRGLPISIITPFGMLTPIFTILLSLSILNEKIVLLQAVGIAVILVAYYFIGKIGTLEVKGLFRNKYLYMMVASTLLSSVSSIIDKVSLKSVNAGQMQFWFNLFTFMMYAAAYIINKVRNKEVQPLKISYFLILMSIFLVLSDRIYFSALNIPASQISIVMPLRRASIFVSAIIGGFLFKEKNLKKKFVCASVLILGIALVFAGK